MTYQELLEYWKSLGQEPISLSEFYEIFFNQDMYLQE